MVVSDWGGVDQIDPDYYQAVLTSTLAGIDMNMVPSDPVSYMWALSKAVGSGALAPERIDQAVGRILEAKFALGLFESPHPDPNLLDEVGSAEHRALAREAVAKSAVLLKDDGVLPLGPDPMTILVAGVAADDVGIQSGGWTLTWQGRPGPVPGGTSIVEGIAQMAPSGSTVIFNRHGRLAGAYADVQPDVCVAVLGEAPYAEGVGDSSDLELPGTGLVDRMRDDCERIVVIVISGRPVIVTEEIDGWDALIAAWLPGSEGAGVADLLFGVTPFSATLPVAWPATIDQLPLEPGDSGALFPIGFGLTG
jgi:beta-glucosidase